MSDVFVDPTDRGRSFVVVADVAHELARKILYGSEDTSRNNVALNLGKPNFDLIEPTGIGRGVMDPYGWMGLEELENILGFMCARVVGHDMNLSTLRLAGDDLAEKVDKLGAGMASGGLSHDVAGASVQRCIQ